MSVTSDSPPPHSGASAAGRPRGASEELGEERVRELCALLGAAHVNTGLDVRHAHSHDRMPWANFSLRENELPGTVASAVVAPANPKELAQVVTWANEHDVRLVPFGAGSGVLGGTTPIACEVIVDLKRMDRLVALNPVDCTVTVEAGMNGGHFEAELQRRGFTSGHLPQSLNISTVGGWAACRGAGQTSSRYGKIEDIVLGLEAVLPDGRRLVVRPVARRSVGPSVKDLMIGSEGVYGFITELTLRVWRLPEWEHGVAVAFPSLQSGLDALRTIAQSELRPQVMRLYDETESGERTAGIAEYQARPVLCILKFAGIRRLAEIEEALSLEICARHGGLPTTDDPYRHWERVRYSSSSADWQARGYYMDTIEVACAWSALPVLYDRIKAALGESSPRIYFAAHWSHIYPEGACQYMTVRIEPMERERALALHRSAWDAAQRICLEMGGTIAHHHGVGMFRNRWLAEELNAGLGILQAVKDFIDPRNLVNPGKVGMRAPPGVAPLHQRLST